MDVEEGVVLSELIDQNVPSDAIPDNSSISMLDSVLKCPICYEYFDTCVMTDCSHNFCSLCIRKYIQYKTECPVCFKELYDSSLRANRIVDEFTKLYPQIKDRIVRCVRTISSRKPHSVGASPLKNVEFKTPKCAQPASSKTSAPEVAAATQKPSPNAPSVAKPSGTLTPASNDSRVLIPKMFFSPMKKSTSNAENCVMRECPVCNVFIPERNINRHLDDCLKRDDEASKAKSSPVKKRDPLPKLVFRLLTTNNLRNKAKEYGLNPHGDNETLKTRIQKFTALHNAECDKPNPRPVSELIRQLEKEEKVLASQKLPKNNISVLFGDQSEKSKQKAQYLKENKKDFDYLIEKIKHQQANKKRETRPALQADYCQPSTSKTHFDSNYGAQNDDMLDIDEMKLEKMENDSQQNVELAKNHSSEEEDVFNPTKRRNAFRSKRLDFDECSPEPVLFDAERVKLEPEVEIFEALTDDEMERPFGKDAGDDTDDMSDSPVIGRSTRRKRTAGDEPVKKVLRKRKR